jgi:glycosyltransferase involved in cell wall biosynthesis
MKMPRVKKICHLTSVHPALDRRIFYKECSTLVKYGYEVVLIAPCIQDFVLEGVRIRAIKEVESRWERRTSILLQIYRSALDEDADVYHLHDPELLIVGFLLRLKRKTVLYDLHEDTPRQILTNHSIPHYLRLPASRGIDILELLAYRLLFGFIAATPQIAQRFGITKTTIVQNFPILSDFMITTVPYASRPANILYVGAIAELRGISEVVSALPLLPAHLNAKLLLVGKFSPRSLKQKMQVLDGWSKVLYYGWQDRKGILSAMEQSRIGLVTLHPEANYLASYPVKMFEYMSSGIPIVASDFPLWRTILEDANCGLFVDPLDPEGIASAVTWLLQHPQEAEEMGKAGQKAVLERFNWENEAQKLIDFYGEVIGSNIWCNS